MRISVHYSTPTTPKGFADTIIGEVHSHVETLCMIGVGLMVSTAGVMPADYSIWSEDPTPTDPARRTCRRAVGTHQAHINMTEAEAFPQE